MELHDGGWADQEEWDDAIDRTVSAMIQLEKAVSPYFPEAFASADAVIAAMQET